MKAAIDRLLPYRPAALWVSNAALVVVAYLLALFIDAELKMPAEYWQLFLGTLPLLLLVRLGTFARFHLFEGLRNGECGISPM
jgi:hypothetical protein